MKVVKDGVYETAKMNVVIEASSVIKTFKKVKDYKKRYFREKIALQRLIGLDNFPKLLHFDDENTTLTMSRLKGTAPETLSVKQIILLREMVANMLAQGVARHAMPVRDLLADSDENLGMVDFERITFRSFEWSPIWLIAKKVSHYHLYRLIRTYQPQQLTEQEYAFLAKTDTIRDYLMKLKPLKLKLKNMFKNRSNK
ncbi:MULTISPECIES: hypothetical protein [unclassified Shewanella]|uniref:hypothetical protein n=1 Tax=unclassified Shewanella TaxID=196818 RepID=UPI000C81B63B|nr:MULTISPECIES: hypothetical protein [unclassified Shewanella]MDO6619506.1 hypothetical protein [Shewanella sp. 6_MG-2023]MDO6639461.1 hypothetical protein [Shewanella sp. 5_MG-2023]MDO6678224.1 hypothetical protein [Shewanella sp. 4_MG-2023]MDO6775958.1 hypothetical protein [Shewanella sp. 3_MG-2023]PMG30261.1 hypothetical protein BCU94_11725 [Shewanella sp. 10N.286.52.C2]